ncbi:MAG TPA: NapC/NirT family cytochrome c [Bdellovibrionota bacterium]|nr:NapC/NirT family cytochrome c [Bdellovibrionota bacterium]
MRKWFNYFFLTVTQSPLSLAGSTITTASAFTFLALFAFESLGYSKGPYFGILTFMIVPAVFVAGLVLIPVGIWVYRRRLAQGALPRILPVIDLNNERTRKVVLAFAALTIVNLGILGIASYKGLHVMESNAFCGTTCHTVMQPEHTAHLRSPHARVNCVDCHIGAGANWFVKSKLSGSWQVVATAFNLYPRPIPYPIHNLRPARETCEQCHWPEKFVGDRLKVITRYKEDEKNTELKTVLLLRIGGIEGRESHGIHWHVDRNVNVRYLGDEKRDNIYDVELIKPDGSVVKYATQAERPKDARLQWRNMDCVDCHNRPTHIYRMPSDDLDRSIQEGKIDRSLPFIRREGLRLLKVDYSSHDDARKKIREGLTAFYAQQYPAVAAEKKEFVGRAADELGNLYSYNVFPAMKVKWGTYTNRIGHENSPGCQRCHDGDHKTAGGAAISDDCDTCHSLLAQEEENPKILAELQP